MLTDLLGGDVKTGDLLGKSEIPYHPSMDIHDASKIQAFMDSPRKYFYQYILGWRPIDPNIHLTFGSAWHEAMEHLLLSINTTEAYSDVAVREAWEKFNDMFTREFDSSLDYGQFGAKEPGNALKALIQYVQRWAEDRRKYETLYTEVAGSVPISDSRVLHFKLDSILREKSTGNILSMEHKTTGRKTNSWLESWAIIMQPWVYNHALRSVFQDQPVKGVTINGVILRKTENEFIRIPVGKSDDMMADGLWKANHYMDLIDWYQENLLESSPDDQILPAFPCNGTSCSKFGCSFSAFCGHWANPLQKISQPPPGFTQEFWDPRREDTKSKIEGGVITTKEGTDDNN